MSACDRERQATSDSAPRSTRRFARPNRPYLATLNDDAVADPRWLEKLVAAAEAVREPACARPKCAWLEHRQLDSAGSLDSAGMLIAIDGSSKQRGHGEPPAELRRIERCSVPQRFGRAVPAKHAGQIGLFDETFFLYCEDTDLGLRARWAGWECAYVPGAIVEHRYSHSAGRASPLKAYYVERNRLYTAVKNFPWPMLLLVKPASLRSLLLALGVSAGRPRQGAEFRDAGPFCRIASVSAVSRAWIAATVRLPRLWRERRRILQDTHASPPGVSKASRRRIPSRSARWPHCEADC